MYNYQLSIICALFIIFTIKASRLGALIVLVELFLYYTFVIDLSAKYYYCLTALLNLAAGIILQKNYKYAAVCSYVLVLCNAAGFYFWYLYLEPVAYNISSAIILYAQVVFILQKGIKESGEYRYTYKYPMDNGHGFYCIKPSDTMHKTKQTKNKKA